MRLKLFTRIMVATLLLTTLNTSAQMNKPTSLNHIALYVYDLTKSTEFYKDVIGIQMIPEPFHDGKHSWFKVGEHSQLHLIEGAKSITEHDRNSHLCFSVTSMDDFIALLNKHNIPFSSWAGEATKITIRTDGVKQIYFKDPDGYWVEINNDTY